MPLVGVVGHTEWVEFARVARVPRPGEIVHAGDAFAVPGGGGAVAAVQLRRLAGAATFLAALGEDGPAASTRRELERHGVALHAAVRPRPHRRGWVFVDDAGERTITVIGERLVPHRDDPLPWAHLGDLDAVYLTGGDAGAVRAARAARILVATPRALRALTEAGVRVDVLVGSATDPGEAYAAGTLDPEPHVVVATRGAQGGEWRAGADAPAWVPAGRRSGRWAATPLPGAPADAYGCGDSFAAGVTYGLAAGLGLDGALRLGARCGAACLTGRGPYAGQLGA